MLRATGTPRQTELRPDGRGDLDAFATRAPVGPSPDQGARQDGPGAIEGATRPETTLNDREKPTSRQGADRQSFSMESA